MDFGILEGVLDCLVFGVEAKSNNFVDLVDYLGGCSGLRGSLLVLAFKKIYQAYTVQSPPRREWLLASSKAFKTVSYLELKLTPTIL